MERGSWPHQTAVSVSLPLKMAIEVVDMEVMLAMAGHHFQGKSRNDVMPL